MKILFCNKYDFPFSGTEKYIFEIMEILRARGHEVALFSMNSSHTASGQSTLPPPLDFKNASHSLWKRALLAGHAIYSFETRCRLRHFIEDFRPDVAHVRNIYHHLSPSLLWELRRHRIPVLYHLNDFKLICPTYNLVAGGHACDRCGGGHFHHVLTNNCYAGPTGGALVLAIEAYLHLWLSTYRNCVTRFLTPSFFAREKLIENGWDGNLIDVLHHPQTIPAQPPPLPRQPAPLLYFGRLSREKGLVDVLRAAHKLPNTPFQLAGAGPEESALRSLVRELNLTNVTFLGQLNAVELQKRIAASLFTIFPSHAYETFGKSITESYAQARPVVATDLGSRRELVQEGETGFLYRPGDHEALANAIHRLYSQPSAVEQMGVAGYELVRRHHSPAAHCDALVTMYERLATRAKPASITRRAEESEKLRVAFIGGRGVGSKYSGIETWYEEVGSRLADRGHEITVCCRNYFTSTDREYRGMRILRLPTIRTKHLETLVHTALSTIRATFGPYDIVHFHALGPALFSFLPRLMGKKTLVSVQGLDWQRKKWGGFASSVLRLGEWAAVAFPSSTIVVSRTLQAYYHETYRADTSYVPNGTELRGRSAIQHLPAWNLESGRYLLFLGRFSPEKNCDLLIRAFEGMATDVKLVLAGGSSHSDAYARDLRKHQSERILLLDWISGDALHELLTHAMLFVLPSDMEGLSLALLDAMGAGVCVLASDVPENRELVDNAGFTFRRGDASDLRHKIEMIIHNPDLRADAARKAWHRVQENYLWTNIAAMVEHEYQRVLGQSDGRDALASRSAQRAA